VDARFVAAVAALATAVPTGVAPPVLHLVGRGSNGGGVCGNVVVHANAAISAALRDDQTLDRTIDRLRVLDFEESTIAQRNGVAELHNLSGDLAETSSRGASEVQRLRGYALRIDEDRQRTELAVFADALESALDRQHWMGLQLDRFLAELAYREMRERALQPPDADAQSGATPLGFDFGPGGYDHREPANTVAHATAADFDRRLADVRRDESHAADLSEAAVGGC
jgi:hypothetical protein